MMDRLKRALSGRWMLMSVTAFVLLMGGKDRSALADEGTKPVRFDGHQVIRATVTTRQQLATLLQLAPDVWSERIGLGPLDVRIAPEQIPALKRSGIPYEVLINDVQVLIDREQQGPENPGPGGSWYDDYKMYEEVLIRLDEMVQLRPDLAQTFDVGQSLEGRMIRGIRIGEPGPERPALFIQSCQHAREWISIMATMYFVEMLITGDGVDDRITSLLDEVVVYVVPIINPDGYVYTWTNNRLWRKNRRNNGNGTFGVDLNRNWSFGWGGEGSSGNSGSEIYRGPAPFSEPESTAMSDFLQTVPNLYAHVDVHSYGQLILQPWGWTFDTPPDHARFNTMGAAMESLIEAEFGTDYVHGAAAPTLYLADGISPDWSYGELGASSFTFELRDTGEFGFVLPADQIIPTSVETAPAFLYLMEYITRPMVILLPDGLPTRAEPSGGTTFRVQIEPVHGGELDESTPALFVRNDGGTFDSYPLVKLSDDLYEATLPPGPCGEELDLYLAATSTAGTTVTLPGVAPDEVFSIPIIEFGLEFVDDFEEDLGWTVVNSPDLTDGAWERGVPAGGGDRGDPPADGDGSGHCYLTDNADGNSDVDGGATTLISPTLDASGTGEPYLSYWRWYSNSTGAAPESDVFTVEISNDDGDTWSVLEVVGPTGAQVRGGWYFVSFRLSDFLPPTSTMRVRFTAEDAGQGSVVEAAVDGVRIDREFCQQTAQLTNATVTFGTLVAGGVAELEAPDASSLRARSRFGFTALEPNLLLLDVDADSPIEAADTLRLTLDSRMNHPNGTAIVRLRNVQTNQWETIETYSIGLPMERIVIDKIDAVGRVDQDGTIRLQLKHIVPAVFTAIGFESHFDWVVIEVE